MKKFLLAASLLSSTAFSQVKIVNPDPLASDRYPAVGYIEFGKSRCIGTAIDPYHVVTSASCLTDLDPQHLTWHGTQQAAVRLAERHPRWRAAQDVSQTVNLARLTLQTGVTAAWFPSQFTGSLWNNTEGLAVSFDAQHNKQTGRLRLKGFTALWDGSTWVWQGLMFRPGPKHQTASLGDEGSPVFVDGKLAGILSRWTPTWSIYTPARYVWNWSK